MDYSAAAHARTCCRRNVGTAKDGGSKVWYWQPAGIPRLNESTMLQADARSDTPAAVPARQRFTDGNMSLLVVLTVPISALLMRAVALDAGPCNRRPPLCRSYPASRFDRAPPVGGIIFGHGWSYFGRTPQYTRSTHLAWVMYRTP